MKSLALPFRNRIFRRAPRTELPTRISERIEAQESASEVLLGWIQLAIVVGFGVVYIVSPKTFAADAPFRPVPWVLSAYLVFTLFRQFLALRRRLSEWFRYTSIVVDMSLLVALIWSFHLQYQQPPSFYLKAPTLMYIFIFIALRTLNFDMRKVLTSGAVALAGWIFLVAYVIRDPANTMITNDYVHYMTSNSVLIGAEVDKAIVIVIVTAILSIAIFRSHRLLTFAVTESQASRELARFVPAEVAALVKDSNEGVRVGSAELIEATVMFLDIEGFTAMSERMAPEKLVRTLNEFYAAVGEPLGRYDGVINQFQGDAVLATFNAPRPNTEHAANALRAAIEIESMLSKCTFQDGLTLRARIGINTGTMIHGMIGTPDRLGYTVLGDEVNVAARLEALNKRYETTIMVSEQTRLKAGEDRFPFHLVDEVQLRGRTSTTRIYSVSATPPVAPAQAA
ncbi:MAG TPA: adenylate/guanylate cyclase domain-containing protein [Casimicrobiaceae bacterium]|nr:adenylate/guanylate cyclase domain-containing protein [Casimicrobiaceae bacterium]